MMPFKGDIQGSLWFVYRCITQYWNSHCQLHQYAYRDCGGKVKETSITTVNGASGYNIIADQVFEISIFLLFAFLLSMAITFQMLPVVNNLSGKLLSV